MSRASVGLVVERLLTDEDLRVRLAIDPMHTVAELLRGGDLTTDEIDLFCWTDAALWFLGDVVGAEWGRATDRARCDAATRIAGRDNRLC
jgi:hypothetical protein